MASQKVANCSAAILAGGQSRRFGSCKALAKWGNSTLIERCINAASTVSDDMFIVTSESDKFRFTGCRIVPDIHPGMGPLAGIEAALEHSCRATVIILACDMPLVPPAILEHLVVTARETGADITIPVINGRAQPLCAVYKHVVLNGVKKMIKSHHLKTLDLLDGYRLHTVMENEMKELTNLPPALALRSANTVKLLDEMKMLSYEHVHFS